MGGDSDTSFKIAAGLFGVVVCGLLAIGVAKVAFSGGLDSALGDGGDEYAQCAEVWSSFYGYSEDADNVARSYDSHSETGPDGQDRMWYLSTENYRDPAAAARVVDEARGVASRKDFQKCLKLFEEASGIKLLAPAVSDDSTLSWAMVIDYEGEAQRFDYLIWAEGSTVARLQIWGPGDSGASDFAREQYDAARASVRAKATR